VEYSCVLPNLFVGPGASDEADFEQLQALNISAILSLQSAEDVNTSELLQRRNAATRRGLRFHNLPVVDFDRADLQRKLRDCVEALDDLLKYGEVVYLHCTAGVTRSPTVAAAFLHWKLGWKIEDALARLRSVRACCPDSDIIRSQVKT
jgi:protein-tyrosine phosphatase